MIIVYLVITVTWCYFYGNYLCTIVTTVTAPLFTIHNSTYTTTTITATTLTTTAIITSNTLILLLLIQL